MRPITIAIDGPAGAGKSTVARLVAGRLGLVVLDTGAMYRAVALLALEQGVEADPLMVTKIAEEAVFEMGADRVVVNGRDVTGFIRTLEVGQWASKLSVIPDLRKALVSKQQAIARQGGFILEGRDTTTVGAPDAEIKVFLTASIEERARRRWVEMRVGEPSLRLQTVVLEVVERDHRDYTRTESPLVLAEDAAIIETFDRTPEQIAEQIVCLASPAMAVD